LNLELNSVISVQTDSDWRPHASSIQVCSW